jgi:hypothetical protein
MKKIIKAANHITDSYLFITLSTEGCADKPYFSVTGETKHSCGCLHDEILKSRPDLKPLVDLHLSDLDGVPMHAEANGWYWLAEAAGINLTYGPKQSPETCLKHFCDHCRISNEEAEIIIERIKEKFLEGSNSVAMSQEVSPSAVKGRHKKGVEVASEEWSKIMGGMRPRWKKEADFGVAFMAVVC